MKLTPKQRAFADYYIETGNATESAIRAGYNKKTARQIGSINLTKVDIKSYIDKQMRSIEDKRIAKASEVLEHLTAAMRGEIMEDVVVVEGIGSGESASSIIQKQISARDRLKAAELLGKRYALFTERIESNTPIAIEFIRASERNDE